MTKIKVTRFTTLDGRKGCALTAKNGKQAVDLYVAWVDVLHYDSMKEAQKACEKMKVKVQKANQ